MSMNFTPLRRSARSLGLVTVGVLSTLGALSLAHVGPASAQSPGVNLAALVAKVNALQTQQTADEATITSQGNTIKSQGNTITSLQNKQTTDETSLGKLQTLTAPFSLSSDPSAGGTNTLLTISGVNVQIVNGQGSTETANGLGNLIIGYDEKGPKFTQNRTGSHNLVVGMGNNYLSYGGIVAGLSGLISAPYASVLGGEGNVAKAPFATVTGGQGNLANGGHASVVGGFGNIASGGSSATLGGNSNTASGDYASVSGGFSNTASSFTASVSGGVSNTASGQGSSVSGGVFNTASGANQSGVFDSSSVSGGQSNTASGQDSSVSGGSGLTEGSTLAWKAGSESGVAFPTEGNFASP